MHLNEIRVKNCPHLCVENLAPEILANLIVTVQSPEGVAQTGGSMSVSLHAQYLLDNELMRGAS